MLSVVTVAANIAVPNDLVARWHMMLPPRREAASLLVPQVAPAI